ncbi:MAG TPA: peptide-N4-asparagine amidase [Streptosporangiaceae bacterium]|nr:peptide-N4-asparagine amidase [Streptosporangiaceae bacterium]
MRLPFLSYRRGPLIAAAAALVLASLGGTVTALAASNASHADHPHRVAPPALTGHAAQGTHGPVTTANPLTLDPPIQSPPTRPVVVTIADKAAFGNGTPPVTTTEALPKGHWAQVVLDVTGTESGRQFDRLCEVFDGPAEIFLGVTPEPTPTGITWHVRKDITSYLPMLSGTQTFSTFVDNFLSSTDTGIPVITAKLFFYPADGDFQPAQPASLNDPALAGAAVNETGPVAAPQHPTVPTDIVPILPSGATSTLNTVNAGQTLSATVTLPTNVTTATLDLYAVAQINDEFWWSLVPAFREIEVSIDGKPAGVVWPYPYVYTGGVNPLIWRPLTGIHTMDIPSYRLDLTPFAGMLGGTHTISLTVTNNTGFWLAGGSLMLTNGGQATTGGPVTDTLTFPTTSTVSTSNALGSTSQPVTTESAATSYEISGHITQGGRTWTDTTRQQLQFGDDQSLINPTCSGPCYQWVHGEQTQSGAETVSGPGADVRRSDTANWTVDAPNGFLTDPTGNDFFLPADVNQQLTDVAKQDAGFFHGYQTSLSESIIGYGALEEDSGAASIADGDTTGTITAQSSGGFFDNSLFQRTVVTRGGAIVQDITQPSAGTP